MKKVTLTGLLICKCSLWLVAQTASGIFEKNTMQYKGDKQTQVKRLLKKVSLWGKVSANDASIDQAFLQLLNSPIEPSKAQLQKYIQANNITTQETGGNINNGISFIVLNGQKIYARYFVIHDVSSPVYKDSFPKNINEASWPFNNASKWNSKKTHTYVTRTGACNTVTDFSEGLRATKFELNTLGTASRGLFIHIELVQPRKYPPGNNANAPAAPQPGFTDIQYVKLALLYVCAGVRKGEWLVPAFHAVVDEGLNDGHDDPQNFEVDKFTNAVLKLIADIKAF